MNISNNQSIYFTSIQSVNVSSNEINKIIEIFSLFACLLLHSMFISFFDFPKHILNSPSPPDLSTNNSSHTEIFHDPLSPLSLSIMIDLFFSNLLQRRHHFLFHFCHPIFHWFFSLNHFSQLELFSFV
jgi:hypothetical protein